MVSLQTKQGVLFCQPRCLTKQKIQSSSLVGQSNESFSVLFLLLLYVRVGLSHIQFEHDQTIHSTKLFYVCFVQPQRT